MGLDFDYTLDQTPLDEDEKEGLLIPTIATRSELDEFEQQNIEDTIHWVLARSFKPMEILTEKFAKNLHKRMTYLKALREADKNNYEQLISFARS